MGVEIHELRCLRYLSARQPLGEVITVGRHWLLVDEARVAAETGFVPAGERYCDPLIRHLGASRVRTIDASDYEGAELVFDLGRRQADLPQCDTVIDFGSLEHIFDAAAAFHNVMALCRVGGRIAHVLPANNLAGHGFWQFSADLFFELYSADNGFADTEVYYASSFDARHWYRARRSRPGERGEFVSLEPVVIICITRKVADRPISTALSQPFYSAAWEKQTGDHLRRDVSANQERGSLVKRMLGRARPLYRLARNAHLVAGLARGSSRYSLARRFERVAVEELIARPNERG